VAESVLRAFRLAIRAGCNCGSLTKMVVPIGRSGSMFWDAAHPFNPIKIPSKISPRRAGAFSDLALAGLMDRVEAEKDFEDIPQI
jgi:hypothetical protein